MLGLKNKSTLGAWEVGKSEPDGYTFLRLCKIYEIEDIYGAFGEIPPVQFRSDAQDETIEKHNLLNAEFQKIADNLVAQLFEIQEKGKQ